MMQHDGENLQNQTVKKEPNTFDDSDKSETIEMIRNFINSIKSEDKYVEETREMRKKKEKVKYINENQISSKKLSYKCKVCAVTKKTRKHMFKHVQTHIGAPRSCLKCKQTFNGKIAFQWHLKYHCKMRFEDRWKYTCSLCSRYFFSKRTLQSHIDGHERNNCNYCDKTLTRKVDLIQHLFQVHSIRLERETFKCEHCERSFIKKCNLYYHLQQHYPNKCVCLECGQINETIEESNEHKKQHDRKKRFTCKQCGDKFSRRQQYLYHIKKHNRYRCVTCDENFASRVKVIKHKQKGHEVEGLKPQFLCSMCPLSFHRENVLVLHMKKHIGSRSVSCQYCKKTFSSNYAYYKHCITVNHEKSSPEINDLSCTRCGKHFFKRYDLTQHMYRVHNFTKKAFVCQHCNYKTVHKSNMDRHIALHFKEENKYTCEYCGKTCDSLSKLNDHISYNHIQTKQYKCDKCDKSFKRNSELVRHQESHSDERPHSCDICGKAYKRLNHLKRHQQQSHQIVNESRRIKSIVELKPPSPKMVILQHQPVLPAQLINVPIVDINLQNDDLTCYLPFENEDLNRMCSELDFSCNVPEFSGGQ